MKLALVTYLGALSRINAILIVLPRISAHLPILAQCKVHHPWALFREGTVICTALIDLIQPVVQACKLKQRNQEATIIELVDSISRDGTDIPNTLQIPKYLKTDNFMKFLSVKIRISSKLCI